MIEYEIDPISIEVDQDYIAKELSAFGGKMQTIIRRGMRSTPKTGRRYRRGSKTHIASSVGNYPAIDTGRLSGSINFQVRKDLLEVGADASAGVNYAKFVDPTRPFLERGLRDTFRSSPDFLDNFVVVRREV